MEGHVYGRTTGYASSVGQKRLNLPLLHQAFYPDTGSQRGLTWEVLLYTGAVVGTAPCTQLPEEKPIPTAVFTYWNVLCTLNCFNPVWSRYIIRNWVKHLGQYKLFKPGQCMEFWLYLMDLTVFDMTVVCTFGHKADVVGLCQYPPSFCSHHLPVNGHNIPKFYVCKYISVITPVFVFQRFCADLKTEYFKQIKLKYFWYWRNSCLK